MPLPNIPPPPQSNEDWQNGVLLACYAGVQLILSQQETLMAGNEQLQARLDDVQSALTEVLGRIEHEIQQLADQRAKGEPPSQAQLDGFQAVADALRSASTGLAADDEPAPQPGGNTGSTGTGAGGSTTGTTPPPPSP